MTKIPLGKVAFTDAGSYNAGKTYKRFDFVDTEDSSYLSLQDNNKGHAITETAWWKCLARGTKATEAAKKANDAAALANEKAMAADTAADIYGRNSKKSSDNTYPWNTSEYPNLVHWDNDHWDSLAMGAGDSLTVLLIYDSSKGGSKGGYPLTYTARIINRQN